MKKQKKINPKDTAKNEIMSLIRSALENAGMTISDGVDYGMTKGTLVVGHEVCDVQIKPITPKAGIDRYERFDEEEGE